MDRLSNKFLFRKEYAESEIIPLNDNLYISLIPGNLGENPLHSKYWMRLKEYELGDDKKYLGLSKDKTLPILKKILAPQHTNFYIHTNNKNGLEIEPQGDLSFRAGKGKDIIIKPIPGYKISKIYENGRESSWKRDENCDPDGALYKYEIYSDYETVGTTQDILIEI